jgi:hypothetical protein
MTYPLHLNISDGQKKFLDAFADARGLTISGAVRLILHDRETQERKEE